MHINYDKAWCDQFDLLIHPVFLLDLERKIINCNLPLVNLLKKEKKDIIGKKCYELIHSLLKPLADCPFQNTLKTKCPTSRILFEPRIKRWLSVGTSPILEGDKMIGGLHIILDITEEKAESEKLILEEKDKLAQKLEELSKLNAVMVGRETKIIEIKREVNQLLIKAGRPPRYQV